MFFYFSDADFLLFCRLGIVEKTGTVVTVNKVAFFCFILRHGRQTETAIGAQSVLNFSDRFAFAGSEDFYDKQAYIFIALAPIVIWGIVLGLVNVLVPLEWFWVIYLIQVSNLSGAAGDLFVTVKFSRLPKDILVRDYGVGMKVYSKE